MSIRLRIKPCPFCGGEAKLVRLKPKSEFYVVACSCCGARTNFYYLIEQDAIKAWNRRVEPTFTPDELDEIRKALKEYSLKSRKQWELGLSIIEKCAKALKGGSVE